MNYAIEAHVSALQLARWHRRVTGLATVAAAGTYLATDAVELAFDFSPAQLWALAVGLLGLPALLNVAGNVLRNLGLVGMELAILRGDGPRRDQ